MSTYKVIGLMSGTSMDGLDIAYCNFTEENGKWGYEILKCTTVPYPTKWQLRLSKLVLQNAINYIKTHVFYGHYIGATVSEFIEENNLIDQVDFISSHGQTIFHQPENNLTSQIGDGAAIAAETGLPVVSNFRTMDVAMAGQGTPISPIGEKNLFPDYKFYLNLGGIANITCKVSDGRYIAFDTCPVNLVLNALAHDANHDYDENGNFARDGSLNQELLDDLNGSWYYEKEYPKSLSGGWVSKVFMPIIKRCPISTEDKLRTACEHIGVQVARDLEVIKGKEGISLDKGDKMLVTGGGAFNSFLVERLKEHVPVEIELPDEDIIKFKEAIIIGLMGALRVRNEINCLNSVTGASQDNIGGAIYQGTTKTV